MFPHEFIKTMGENRTGVLDSIRMCPRCLEDGRISWVRIEDPHAHAKPCGDQDRQYCGRCNSTWDFVECFTLAAWMEGVMSRLAVIDYDGTDIGFPVLVEKTQWAQERQQQEKETLGPAMRADTRHGWTNK